MSLKRLHYPKSIKASKPGKDILEYFFMPLVRIYLDNMAGSSYSQALYELFGVDERPINFYKVIKEFKLPGRYRINSVADADGYKNPYVKYGTILTVREDDSKPNVVGVQHKEDCFNLTRSDWNKIQHKVKLLD